MTSIDLDDKLVDNISYNLVSTIKGSHLVRGIKLQMVHGLQHLWDQGRRGEKDQVDVVDIGELQA